MEHSLGICNLSVIPVRAEASDKSEMVNQLIFGDRFRIIDRAERWVLIQNVADNYMGWIDHKQFAEISLADFIEWEDAVQVTGLSPVNLLKKIKSNQTLHLVPGSSIPVGSLSSFSINEEVYESPDMLLNSSDLNFAENIEAAARFYLNTPYLWGGRSPFGIDCSGFCQVVFKLFGIKLMRDSSQQAAQGKLVHFLSEAIPGDLAFFDNEEGRIIHVGILLGNSTIIHASGRVKIDAIDTQGIYSEELGRHTHKLRIIKRVNREQ